MPYTCPGERQGQTDRACLEIKGEPLVVLGTSMGSGPSDLPFNCSSLRDSYCTDSNYTTSKGPV